MNNAFSICIPNYNYEQYIGITLQSVVDQRYPNYEVVIADNASTDKSIEIIQKFCAEFSAFRFKINPTNIGFAANLDEAGRMARQEWMIMLSSDDAMTPDTLETYNLFIQSITSGQKFAFCSTFEKIDGNGNFIEFLSAQNSSVWEQGDIDPDLSNRLGFTIYKVKANEMLKRCLTRFINPFNFASTCYQASTYNKVGGYGGGRLYNPDKWFHWKLLSEVDYVYYLDKPLVQYRWHSSNQANQQIQTQVLKYWLDEYRNAFEVTEQMLVKSGLKTTLIQQAFIDRTIIPYVYAHLIKSNLKLATRIFLFGKSCYPDAVKKNMYYWPLRIALSNIILSKLFILVNGIITQKVKH